MPSERFLSLTFDKLDAMDEQEYRETFHHSAVKRAKFAGLKRNVAAISINRRK